MVWSNTCVRAQDNEMVIPLCSRSGDVIEPLMKPQWWVDVKEMAARSVEAVRSGELKLIPKSEEVTWYVRGARRASPPPCRDTGGVVIKVAVMN